MSDDFEQDQALILFDRAYRHQMRGELADAILLYKRSINMYPTAKAHTFLGWSYSMMSRYDEAIDECRQAIALDPDYGNPYNDIGAYLIEQNKWEEAIPWLKKAIEAPNYDAPQFPHMNLGRIFEHRKQAGVALDWYNRALAIDPFYRTAHWAKYKLLGRLN